MISAASIGRKVTVLFALVVAAIASAVILLSTGPTAMKASTFWLRNASARSVVANWTTSTLSGATPDSVRMILSRSTLAGVFPMTPTFRPERLAILAMLD